MEVIFEEDSLREIYETGKTSHRKYKAFCKKTVLVERFRFIVDLLQVAKSIGELRNNSTLHYERLKHQNEPLSSIRIKNGFVERLICRESENGIVITLLEIDETHYGNKK